MPIDKVKFSAPLAKYENGDIKHYATTMDAYDACYSMMCLIAEQNTDKVIVVPHGTTIITSGLIDQLITGKPPIAITEIAIPSTVTTIDPSALSDLINLKFLILPNSIKELGMWSLGNVVKVRYNGTISNWNAIDKIGNIGADIESITCLDGVI